MHSEVARNFLTLYDYRQVKKKTGETKFKTFFLRSAVRADGFLFAVSGHRLK